MHPILIEIGSLSIHWYGVMAAMGFLAASFLLNLNRKYVDNMTKDHCGNMLIIAMIGGIVGARAYYVIEFFHAKGFSRNLVSIFYIHQGGLVFFGGFILAFISVVVYSIWKKLDTLQVLDAFVPSLTAAHAFGRIGCFLEGCCYGKATTAFWGITAPQGSKLWLSTKGQPVHPIQLVESAENIILCLFFCWLLSKKVKRGVTLAIYLICYAVLRFINETMRINERYILNLSGAQCICVLLALAGTGLLIFSLRHEKKA